MAETPTTPRDIPEGIKRTVRQRCRFGCVVCGLPLYEYHHMVEWAKVQAHDPGEITLLCNLHHREATNRLLSPDQIRLANANPFNISQGVFTPYGLHFELNDYRTFHAVIGGNRFSTSRQGQTSLISIDNTDLVWVRIDEQGQLFLHMNIFDDSNNRVLCVVENQLQYTSVVWDITFVGKTLTLRQASRDLLLQITFLPPSTISIDRGCLLFNGVEITISPKFIYNGASCLAGCLSHNCQAGLVVGRNDRGLAAAFGWPTVLRYSPYQRRQHKQDAIQKEAELPDILEPHSATGTQHYVSTVQGSEDFHIIDESRETETPDP